VTAPPAASLSDGQVQAVRSLRAIADQSRAALTVELGQERNTDGILVVRIWLSSQSLPHSESGHRLRPWEPIDLLVPDDFPFRPPIAWAGHSDFDHLPQVAKGSAFCLRVLPNDWDPSAGMTGFVQQVIGIYRHISLGTLAGNLLPWHPPEDVLAGGCVVVKADPPVSDLDASEPQLCWAACVQISEQRVDIVDWLAVGPEPATASSDAAEALDNAIEEFREKHPEVFFAPAMIMSKPAAFEYRSQFLALLQLFDDLSDGFSFFEHLTLTPTMNHESCDSEDEDQDEQEPALMLFGAPADGGVTAADTQTRFSAGWLSPDTVCVDVSDPQQLAAALLAPVIWARTYDGRPQTMRLRDSGRPTTKLAGARVLVLGCGALGAPIAEHCLRAGAAELHLVDAGAVSPGVLTRQPYVDADIGEPKAEVLAERLSNIQPSITDVTASVANILSSELLVETELGKYDLILDATANRSVATFIERAHRNSRSQWPALVTLAISQNATTGAAAVTPPGAAGAGVDLLRRLGLATGADPELADVHDDFFPPPERRTHFQAEPGCSDATFIGSTTDVSALAAQLLDSALERLGPIKAGKTSGSAISPRSLCIVRLGRDAEPRPARTHLPIPPDHVLAADDTGYEVRIADGALAKLRRLAGTSADQPIGGLLLGQLDVGTGIIWVSEAIAVPAGSGQHPLGLEFDPPEAKQYAPGRSDRSNGLERHIGFWHVSRDGMAPPTAADERTLVELLDYSPGLLLLTVITTHPQPPTDQQPPDLRVKVLLT